MLFKKDSLLFQYPCALKSSKYIVPSSVKDISNSAFEGARNLESICLNDSVHVSSNIFVGCSELKHVIVPRMNPFNTSEDGKLFNKSKTEFICYPEGLVERTYTIPYGIQIICENAFRNAKIQIIKMSKSVKRINRYAFYESRIKKVVLNRFIEMIDDRAFDGCTSFFLQIPLFSGLKKTIPHFSRKMVVGL